MEYLLKKLIISYHKLKAPSIYELSNYTSYFTGVISGMKETSPSGEFEFSRYPFQHWEDAILKMKSAGFYGFFCCVLRLVHAEKEKEWNWEVSGDFRHFLELCSKHNMGVYARIGAWEKRKTQLATL